MHFSQNEIGEFNESGEETFINQKKEYPTEKGRGEPIVALAQLWQMRACATSHSARSMRTRLGQN